MVWCVIVVYGVGVGGGGCVDVVDVGGIGGVEVWCCYVGGGDGDTGRVRVCGCGYIGGGVGVDSGVWCCCVVLLILLANDNNNHNNSSNNRIVNGRQ